MNVLLVNGSPRPKGNSAVLLQEMQWGFEENIDGAVCTSLSAYKQNISACVHCDSCRNGTSDVCVQKDDTQDVIAMIEKADVLILVTPVYWWGISAKLKLIVDKLYSRVAALKTQKKRLIVCSVGHGDVTDRQYDLIQGQFECIATFLQWDLRGCLRFSAHKAGEIAENDDAIKVAHGVWKLL